MANQATSLTRIIKAAGYSYKGLAAVWRYEAAFRQERIWGSGNNVAGDRVGAVRLGFDFVAKLHLSGA